MTYLAFYRGKAERLEASTYEEAQNRAVLIYQRRFPHAVVRIDDIAVILSRARLDESPLF